MASKETRDLANRGIKLLEEAMERDFGLKPELGAELEFGVYPKDKATFKGNAGNPLGLEYEGKKAGAEKLIFRDSPYISNVYKDGYYELVFHHNQHHGSALVLARAIDAAKNYLSGRKWAGTPDKPSPYDDLIVSFEAHQPLSLPMHPFTSLQINISLCDKAGNNIFHHNTLHNCTPGLRATEPDPLFNELGVSMLQMQEETLLLHAPYEASYVRFTKLDIPSSPASIRLAKDSADNTSSLKYKKAIHPDSSEHLENRLAGSDADPSCVILATLAATYHALKQGQGLVQTDGLFTLKNAPKLPKSLGLIPTHAQAIRNFKEGTLLRGVLNEVSGEEKLGERFCAAVEADLAQPAIEPEAYRR